MALATPARFRLSDPWARAVAITVAAGALRLLVGALTPLFPDETYYWEWSRRLAAGYFDHPPLIAWAIRAGTLVAGDTPLGVRLGPIVLGTVGALFLAATARRLAGSHAAMWLAAAFAATPLASGLVLATPDAPLLAASAASLHGVVRALQHDPSSRGSFAWWCVAGVSLGLALTAKYTAVLLPCGVFVGMLCHPVTRRRLAGIGPYAATFIALLIFSPVVWWNARNDWISFAFQLRHGLGAVGGSALLRVLEMIGGQAGLVSPVLFVLCAVAVARSARLRESAIQRTLAVTAMVIFGFFIYSATKRRVEANWPALAYLPAFALAVVWLESRRWRSWFRGGVILAAVLSAVVYVNAFTPILPVPARRDPAARAAGWSDLARAVHGVHAPRLSISSRRTWVAAERYQDASELAFHLPDHPAVFALSLSGRASQYGLWPGFPDRADAGDGLIVALDEVDGTHSTLETLTPHFERVSRGELVMLARGGDPVKAIRLWILDGWRGSWPP